MPGDKSISQRALILSSMAIGTTKINGISLSEDVKHLIKNLKLLNVKILKKKNITIVHGVGIGGLYKPKKNLYMGNSGTATRLLLGALCNQNFKTIFTGDKSLSNRSMNNLIIELKKVGAEIKCKNNKLPIQIKGISESIPIFYNQRIPSAQIKSAILLASLNTRGKTVIIENIPTRNHTEILLKILGAKINIKKKKRKKHIEIWGQKELIAKNINIAGDPSAASIIGAAALITSNSRIKIKNININQRRITFFKILKKMNAKIKITNKRRISGEEIGDITFSSSKLKGINLTKNIVSDMIDEIPIFAILAALSKGKSSFSGGSELKNKESDRIHSLYLGLKACGINIKKKKDGLIINSKIKEEIDNKPINIKTFYDHRLSMAFLIMGLAYKKKIIVDNIDCIKTSFPNFFDVMKKIGARFQKKS